MHRALIALLAYGYAAWALEEVDLRQRMREARFDGKPIPAEVLNQALADTPAPLTGTVGTIFTLLIGPAHGASSRIIYRMDDPAAAWTDVPSRMSIFLVALDHEGRPLKSVIHELEGETPGWTGDPATSLRTTHRLILEAPPTTEALRMTVLSGEARRATVGILGIANPVLHLHTRTTPNSLSDALPIRAGHQQLHPLWQPGLRSPQLVRTLTSPEGVDLLVIQDDTAEDTVSVIATHKKWTPLTHQETIELTYEYCHSLGHGGPAWISTPALTAGPHHLIIGEKLPNGQVQPSSLTIPISICEPWWLHWSTWTCATCLVIAGAAMLARNITRRRLERQLAQAERQTLLERERSRIARDLHDELGTSLARLTMLGRQAASTGQASALQQLISESETCVHHMRHLVWSLDSQRDSLESLCEYLVSTTESYLHLAQLKFRLHAPEAFPARPVTSAVRQATTLAVRELVHNAIHHGAPSTVTLTIAIAPTHLLLTIHDDGRGFDLEEGLRVQRGLTYQQERLVHVGGTLNVTSTPHQGTTATITIPLNEHLTA